MKNLSYILGLFLLSLALFQTAQGLRCWECKSIHDRNCGNPFDNKTLALNDCGAFQPPSFLPFAPFTTKCRTIRKKVNDEWQYERNCIFIGSNGNFCDYKQCMNKTELVESKTLIIEDCDNAHGCNSKNSADNFYPKMTTLMMSFIIYKLMM